MIKAVNIIKSYGKLNVLKGINIEIREGEIVSIVGASGAGKSTLLHILSTLDKADSGLVEINNIKIDTFRQKQLSEFRNKHIGFVFQFHHLLPEFTALENICIPAYISGFQKRATEKKAIEILGFLNLSDRISHKPSELSGGEQQRVAVARALINNPLIVFADEPSGNLDSKNAVELHELFFKLRNEFNQSFVIATHNRDLANMADRKLHIKDGIINN
ncbi:MAG: ABC transporter ATP-binding protein [Bacteroidales bacterium]|nr:ABC transporter ATP-binding protein [Bacteroidales bacterium]